MLNENAKKWVAALRSGNYPQGQYCLRDIESRHCCLGVAVEISPFPWQPEWPSQGELPPEVKNWLGLSSPAGDFFGSFYTSLVDSNDKFRMTFNQIADLIESEPKGLFLEEWAGPCADVIRDFKES